MDVGEQQVLRVDYRCAVGDPDDGHRQLDESLQRLGALDTLFLPNGGLEDLAQARAVDFVHEDVSGARDDERAIVVIERDFFERGGQVFVRLTGEQDGAAIGVEAHDQYAVVVPFESEVRVLVEICRVCHGGGLPSRIVVLRDVRCHGITADPFACHAKTS